MLTTPIEPDALPPPSSRLESLRGLAAIQVAAYHSLAVMQVYPCNEHFVAPMLVLCNGRSAVTLFFVLSGFVLGLSLRRSKGGFGGIYARYAIRRFFRIYPTVIVSTLAISLFVLVWKSPPLTKSEFINHWIAGSATISSVIQQLFFIRFINPVTWTLRMELVCSLLLPLALLTERTRPKLLPWILLVLIVLPFFFPTTISIIVTPAFFMGYLLPSAHGWWRRVQPRVLVNAGIFLLGTIMLLTPRSTGWPLPAVTLLEAVGAFLMIGTIVYGADLTIFKLLDHDLIKVAGRLSYSYYVYQPVCLVCAAHFVLSAFSESWLAAYPVPAAVTLWLLSSGLAFPVAWFSYAYIEKPCINYAKYFYGSPASAGTP